MKKVLIVDDNPTILASLSYIFNNGNATVCCRTSVEDAKRVLDEYAFDLVITDIRFLGQNDQSGLELLSYIKKIRSETAVIVMTAYGSPLAEEESYQRGAYLYLEKPFDLSLLSSTIAPLGIELLYA